MATHYTYIIEDAFLGMLNSRSLVEECAWIMENLEKDGIVPFIEPTVVVAGGFILFELRGAPLNVGASWVSYDQVLEKRESGVWVEVL